MSSDVNTQKKKTASTNGNTPDPDPEAEQQEQGPKLPQISATVSEKLHGDIAALVGPRYKTMGLAVAVLLHKGLQADGDLTKEEEERYELARQLTGQDGA